MTYRDDLEAQANRAEALAKDLDAERQENDRLRAELAAKAQPTPPPTQPAAQAPRSTWQPSADSTEQGRSDLDLAGSPYWFRVGASPLGFTQIGWFYLIFVLLGFFVSLPLRLTMSDADGVYVILAVPVIAAALGIAGLIMGGPAARRERRWVAALPFAVDGFFGLFTGRDSADRRHRFKVRICYAEGVTGGDQDAVAALLGDDTMVSIEKAGPRTLDLECTVRMSSDDWGSYRRVFAGVHRLVDDVLLPFHQRVRIARIELRSR